MDGSIGVVAIEEVTGATAKDAARWYVLQTHPAQEYRVRRWLARDQPEPDGVRRPMLPHRYRAQLHLEREGYEIWLPECVVVQHLRRMVIRKKGPWFPGYLFVRLDLARQSWRELEEVDGVAGLLLDAGRPRAIDDQRIAGLREACDAKGGVAMIALPATRSFRKGEKVLITSGFLAGYEGLFAESVPSRNAAMLDLICNGVRTEIPEAWLEAAS